MSLIGLIIILTGSVSMVLTMIYVYQTSGMDQLTAIHGAVIGSLISWFLIKTGWSMNDLPDTFLFLPTAIFIIVFGLTVVLLAINYREYKITKAVIKNQKSS